MRTRAAARLEAELEKRGWSHADLAERCGVSRQAVDQWILGGARPRIEQAAELERLLGVRMLDWAVAA